MRRYKYTARDSSDKVVKSYVQAESEASAAKLLLEQGFTPLTVVPDDADDNFISKLTGRITMKDKVVFLRQLSTLLGAGLPLTQSLHSVSEQTENKKFRAILQEVISDVEGGRALSKAMSKHPEVFDKIVIALVTAGETSGTLDKSLRRIADQKEKDAAMISKIRGAMVYPGIVLAVIVAVMIFMLVSVVPQVENLYKDMGQQLPILTLIMIAVANFLINFWWVVIIALGLAAFFGRQYLRTEAGVRMLANLKLNVPLFKGMFRKLYMARFTRTGQTLLSTGVAMLDMLEISAESVNNVIIEEEINRAAEKVKSGTALSSALENEEYILSLVPQMIKIGEQSGKVDEMMGKTAQIYEDELNEEIKALTTTIEPVLMVIMAVLVGGMVGAILFPIYNLVGQIH